MFTHTESRVFGLSDSESDSESGVYMRDCSYYNKRFDSKRDSIPLEVLTGE
jgi:hypothetical protein